MKVTRVQPVSGMGRERNRKRADPPFSPQRRAVELAVGGKHPGVRGKVFLQRLAAEIAIEDLAVLVQQDGPAQLLPAPRPADHIPRLGGGEEGQQVDLPAFVRGGVQGHRRHQDQDIAPLAGVGQADAVGVIAADLDLVGILARPGIPAGSLHRIDRQDDLVGHIDAAAVLHIEHPAEDVLGRDHGGVERLVQLLAVGEILVRVGRLMHLGRHGGELAVVGVYEVGQLQGSGADIVFQGGDYAVLEGVDGFHRRLPDQVAHDAERPYKHHQQRDDDHDGEITKIKPLENRLLFLAGHMRSTSPLV